MDGWMSEWMNTCVFIYIYIYMYTPIFLHLPIDAFPNSRICFSWFCWYSITMGPGERIGRKKKKNWRIRATGSARPTGFFHEQRCAYHGVKWHWLGHVGWVKLLRVYVDMEIPTFIDDILRETKGVPCLCWFTVEWSSISDGSVWWTVMQRTQ